MAKIIVYVDHGVSRDSLYHLFKGLREDPHFQRYTLQRMDAEALKGSDWEEETALVIIPGGRDLLYESALGKVGAAKIKKYVHGGGSYLGICAGAYFGCDAIEFEKGEDLEVVGPRQLKFFPGIGRGSAYGPDQFTYDSERGVQAARISWNETSLYTYFNGGCIFVDADTFSNVQILSRYEDLDDSPAAVISCTCGQGIAVLSGVHVEYSAPFLSSDNPYYRQLLPLLEKDEEKRKSLFKSILNHLTD